MTQKVEGCCMRLLSNIPIAGRVKICSHCQFRIHVVRCTLIEEQAGDFMRAAACLFQKLLQTAAQQAR